MPDPIHDVYERYKHMDNLFLDPIWIGVTARGNVMRDLWQAIKAQIAAGDMSRELGDPCTINEQLG